MAGWNAEPQKLVETGLGRGIQGQILRRGSTIPKNAYASFQPLVECPKTCVHLLLDMGYAKWVRQAEAWLMSTAVREI